MLCKVTHSLGSILVSSPAVTNLKNTSFAVNGELSLLYRPFSGLPYWLTGNISRTVEIVCAVGVIWSAIPTINPGMSGAFLLNLDNCHTSTPNSGSVPSVLPISELCIGSVLRTSFCFWTDVTRKGLEILPWVLPVCRHTWQDPSDLLPHNPFLLKFMYWKSEERVSS